MIMNYVKRTTDKKIHKREKAREKNDYLVKMG